MSAKTVRDALIRRHVRLEWGVKADDPIVFGTCKCNDLWTLQNHCNNSLSGQRIYHVDMYAPISHTHLYFLTIHIDRPNLLNNLLYIILLLFCTRPENMHALLFTGD